MGMGGRGYVAGRKRVWCNALTGVGQLDGVKEPGHNGVGNSRGNTIEHCLRAHNDSHTRTGQLHHWGHWERGGRERGNGREEGGKRENRKEGERR